MTIKKHILLFIFFIVTYTTINAQIDVLCVGNSITWGTGLSDPSTNSYPSQLDVLLGSNYDVTNRGEPGSTLLRNTEHPYMTSGQFYYSIVSPWDIVIISLGTNDSDIDYWISNENFVDDYYALIDAYKNYPGHEDPVFILGFPPPVFDESAGHRNAPIHDEIIPMIKQIANDLGHTTADFYSALSGKPEMFSDGVHPNIMGSQIMAEVANDAIQKALTASGPAPDTPTGLRTIPQLYSIDLEWHANLEDDIYQYRVFRSDSEFGYQNIIGISNAPDTTYTDNNVILDHIYYYAIDAVDLQGHMSGRSHTVQGKTYDQIPPSAPADLIATLEADSIKLNWTPNVENDLSRYYIYRNSDQTKLQESESIIGTIYAPTSSFNDIEFATAENYFYGIKAFDVSGNLSSISNIVNITARSRPVSGDTVITAFEDQIYSFSKADFPFSDDDGDTLEKIVFFHTNHWDYFKYDNNPIDGRFVCDDISKLTFQSDNNAFGDSYETVIFKVIDGFGTASSYKYDAVINVTPVNDEPTLNPIDDVYLIEDSHGILIPIAGITSGQPEEIQNLSVEIIPVDTALFNTGDINYISPASSGSVKIDPVENVFGSRYVTIRIWDDGGTDNGGINYTDESFYFYITPRNDPPIVDLNTITLFEDTDTTVTINGIYAGPWESDQNISISVASNNTELLPTPILTYFNPDTFATLSFTTIPQAHGNTSITLFMSDDGGKELGGTDSTAYTIPIEITSVNDRPSDFNIVYPESDSTIVINKHNLNDIFLIDWDTSTDIENENISYNIIFNNELSELSKYGLNTSFAEFVLKDILSATDTVSITSDSYSVIASDGELETVAGNSGSNITIDGRSLAPAKLNLDQNYPNPFNNSTLIGFDLPKRTAISLSIIDLLGKEVIRLIDNETYDRGYSTVSWNGFDVNYNRVPAGIYFMQIKMQNEVLFKKLLLLK